MRTCLGLLGNIEDAQDVTQEAFVRAFRSFDRFDPTAPFLPWILRIAINLCADLRRKHQHIRSVCIDAVSIGEELGHPDSIADVSSVDPEVQVMKQGLVGVVRQGLQILSLEERLVMEEFYLEDGSTKSERVDLLCSLLSCSPRTVYYKLQTAQEILRNWLIEQNIVEI
jgi:RNA polymerase sigma-70 factor (ECF subfamily)